MSGSSYCCIWGPRTRSLSDVHACLSVCQQQTAATAVSGTAAARIKNVLLIEHSLLAVQLNYGNNNIIFSSQSMCAVRRCVVVAVEDLSPHSRSEQGPSAGTARILLSFLPILLSKSRLFWRLTLLLHGDCSVDCCLSLHDGFVIGRLVYVLRADRFVPESPRGGTLSYTRVSYCCSEKTPRVRGPERIPRV